MRSVAYRQNVQSLRFWGALLIWILGGMSWIGQFAIAETLQDIQKRGVLRVGVKNNVPLLGQIQGDGTLAGFEIELAERIATTIWGSERVQVDYIPLLNQERLPAVANGTVDIAIANLHLTESRRRVVEFSQPYLASDTSFVLRNSVTPENIEDGVIGVLQGSVAVGRLRSAFPAVKLIGLGSYQEVIHKLQMKELDGFAGDRLILRGWQFGSALNKNVSEPLLLPDVFQFSEKGLGLSQVAIAMPKGLQHQNLHQAINLALDTLESSGELQQMRNKWRLSEADATAVVRLETSFASTLMLRTTGTTHVLSTRCHGSITHFRLFDSPVGLACGRSHFRLSTSIKDSSYGKKLIWTAGKTESIQRQHPRIF